MSAIVGKKLGMTQVFTEDGTSVPVTVIEAQPNKVTALRRAERDGYDAVQLAADPVTPENKLTKARARAPEEGGRDRDAHAGRVPRRRGRQAPPAAGGGGESGEGEAAEAEEASSDLKVGDDVTVTSFEPGQRVKVSAVSIGKGFQGTIKRHNFSRGPETHGSHNVRAPGSGRRQRRSRPGLQGHAHAGPDGGAACHPARRPRLRRRCRAQPALDPGLRPRREERHGGGAQRWLRPRPPAQSRRTKAGAGSSAAIKATTLGKQAKSDLPKEIFGEPFHEALVHEAARARILRRVAAEPTRASPGARSR